MLEQAPSWVAGGIDYDPLPLLRSQSASSAANEVLGAARRRFWYVRAALITTLAVLAAVATGATAAATHAAVEGLVAWRNAALAAAFGRGLLPALGAQLGISCGLALAAALAVQLLAPRAASGGVTWVMAYLNGACGGGRGAAGGRQGGAPRDGGGGVHASFLASHAVVLMGCAPSLPAHPAAPPPALPWGAGNDVHSLFTPAVFLVKWAGSVAAVGAPLCLVRWRRDSCSGGQAGRLGGAPTGAQRTTRRVCSCLGSCLPPPHAGHRSAHGASGRLPGLHGLRRRPACAL